MRSSSASAIAAWNEAREIGDVLVRAAAALLRRSAAPRSSGRRTRSRSPSRPCSGRGSAKRAASPSRARALDRRAAGIAQAEQLRASCRRLRRRRRRWSCRAAGSRPTPSTAGAGNARPRPAAAGRGTRAASVSRAVSAWRFEMVDRDERLAGRPARGLGGRSSPTITPPIRPGPAVAATPSRSAKPMPASASACAMSRRACSTCARAAISGTTPP